MGNALASDQVSDLEKGAIRSALSNALSDADTLVAEHIEWALKELKT
jgi:epoxyqueuosine reductase